MEHYIQYIASWALRFLWETRFHLSIFLFGLIMAGVQWYIVQSRPSGGYGPANVSTL